MFELPGTETFLGLTAVEWHSIGDGFTDGFQGSFFASFTPPADEKPLYYKAANIGGKILKMIMYAVVIKVLGVASGGLV